MGVSEALELISNVSNERKSKRIFTSDDFRAMQIDTKNWKFNREEANER
jgi:hypothetical protein